MFRKTSRLLLWLGTLLLICSLGGCKTSQKATPVDLSGTAIPQECCGGTQGSQTEATPVSGLLTFDLGTIEQGPVVSHTFKVKNQTGQAVSYTQEPEVSLPCCMNLSVTPEVVQPGEFAEVTLSFETLRRPGSFDLFARIFPSNDSFTSQFHIGGTVRPALVVSPSVLEFEKSGTIELVISGEDLGKSVNIKSVESNAAHLTVTKSKQTKPKAEIYDVTWDGQVFAMGEQAPAIIIFTDSKIFDWYPVLVGNPSEPVFK